MASPIDIARQIAGFDDAAIAQLKRLIRTWGLIADLSLGDVLVLAPTSADSDIYVVLATCDPRRGPRCTPTTRSGIVTGLRSVRW